MNRKRLRIGLSCAVLMAAIALTGCAGVVPVTEYPITLDQVLTEANQRNRSVVDTFHIDDISEYCFEVDMDGFTEEELNELFTTGFMTGVKPEQARQDIEVLFRLLSGSYAGYAYFGSAEAFDRAKADMLDDIAAYGDTNISAADLSMIIRDHLDFLIDDHFLVGSVPIEFDEAYCWYDTDAYEFHRDSDGYYTVMDDAKWYLHEDMTGYLEYTIGRSGEIVYGLFSVGTDAQSEDLPGQMTLTSRKNEKDITVKWKKSPPKGAPSTEYEMRDTDGIKTAMIAAFLVSGKTNDMINDAKELAEEDYAIVDLRYNQGGMVADVSMWMYNFTGREISPKGTILDYQSVVNEFSQGLFETQVLPAYQSFDFVKENPELFDRWAKDESDAYTVTDIEKGIKRIEYTTQWTPRDGEVLFILNGKDTISAGEFFVYCGRTIENTLVVGTNSGGCLTTADVNSLNPLYLPHSDIGIIYGSTLILYNGPKDFDRYGILPDIYIGADDAAEAVARCIQYYQ